MSPAVTGETMVVGVAGAPVRHSLSPVIHNAWIAESRIDAIYVPFTPPGHAFGAFALGLRGGAIRGLNVTAPFKADALAVADEASERARRAGSANLLLFPAGGEIVADNTDGQGLLRAFEVQAPGFDPGAGTAVILGAGGAARGAAAAFLAAGAPRVVFVNRTPARGEDLARVFGDRAGALSLETASHALGEANVLINATPLGLHGSPAPGIELRALPSDCVVMDMVYRPLRTDLLAGAAARGLRTVDGLEMLIGQAIPSFTAFFGRPPPAIDVRRIALRAHGVAAS
jgi:shikimate dehydrogenase